MDSKAHIGKKPFYRGNTGVFLFCVFLAVIFWLLLKLSESYTYQIEYDLAYENFPKDLVIEKANTQSLKVDIRGSGWALLRKSLGGKQRLLEVPYKRQNADQLLSFSSEDLKILLASDFPPGAYTIATISPPNLVIEVAERQGKMVYVMPDMDITYKEQFDKVDKPKLSPDSIEVFGPASILDSLRYWPTAKIQYDDLDESISETVELVAPESNEVTLSHKSVNVELAVDQYTQGSLVLPITVINKPADVDLTIIPTELTLQYIVSLARYDMVKEKDFKAVVDYNKINAETGVSVAAELLRVPDYVHSYELLPSKVKFIIYQ